MENDKILAKNIVEYSCKVKSKEKVLIEFPYCAKNLVKELISQIYSKNAFPFLHMTDSSLSRSLIFGTKKGQSELFATSMLPVITDMDAYIGISSGDNVYELSDVPNREMQIFSLYYSKPIHHDVRVTKTKWVILEYPSGAFAQLSNKSNEEFEKFFY